MPWRRVGQRGLELLDPHLLHLGGTYGDPEAGDLTRYDELRIEHDRGTRRLASNNRASLLFTTASEVVQRIHQVCCRLA